MIREPDHLGDRCVGGGRVRRAARASAAKWTEVAKQSETPIKMIGKAGEGKLNDRDQLQAAIKSVGIR